MNNIPSYQELEHRIHELESQMETLRNRLEFHELYNKYSNVWETFRDHAGKIVYVSPPFERITGFNITEYINGEIQLFDFVYPEDLEKAKEYFQKQLDCESLTDFECRILRRDLKLIYISISSQPVYNDLGDYLGFRTSCIDITAQKMAEIELKDTLEFTSAIIRTSPQAIVVSDFDGVVMVWNDAAELIFGWSSKEAIGSKNKWFAEDQVDEIQYLRQKVLLDGQIKGLETTCIHKDGHRFSVHFSATILKGANGKPFGILSIVDDITDWKIAQENLYKSELKYSVLFEESVIPISLTKLPEKTFADVNRAFENLFGFKKEEVIGKTSLELGMVRLDEQLRTINAVEREGRVYDNEKHIYTKAGQERIVSTFTSTVRIVNSDHAITTLYDITERKKMELELRYSNERFAKIFEYSPVGCVLTRVSNYKIIDINQSALDLLGFNRSDAIGRTIMDLNVVVDADMDTSVFDLISHSGYMKSTETRRRCKDGTIKDLIVSAELISIKNEQYVLSVMIDNTARKEAERKLRDAHEKNTTIIRTSPQAILVVGLDGCVKQWNSAAEQIFGWTEAEALGRLLPIVPDNKKDELNKIRNLVLKGNVIRSLETVRLHKNGYEIQVNVFVAPLRNPDGSPLGILVMIEDITNRKKAEEALKISEEKYKNILSSLSDNVVTLDDQCHVRYVNHVSPGNRNKGVVGSNWMLALDHNDCGRVSQVITDALENGVPNEIEFQIKDTLNEKKWLQLRSARFYDGNVPNVVLIARDITRRKQSEDELASYREHLEEIVKERTLELERLNATKDKLFSIIAHDLKNPFAVLHSSAELLMVHLDRNDIEKAKLKAAMIIDSSKLGHTLLQNLLDWSQSQIGNIKFKPIYLKLDRLVAETISMVESQAYEKGIEITNAIESEITVFADIDLLQVVIRNLITNSIKFTGKGGFICVKAVSRDGDIVVSVVDSGVGMSGEKVEQLFRIDTKNTTKGTNDETGSGLGLILCKEFVEKHGGCIWVESSLGEGSSFKFTIPQKNNEKV